MLNLSRTDYQYFTESEYYEIIGEQLSEKLRARTTDNSASSFITYTCFLIKNYIEEMSAKRLFKETLALDEYTLYLGLVPQYSIELSDEQINGVKLACIYQADYMLDNGSSERMSALGIVNRSNKYSKDDLKSFEICTIAQDLLSNLGITYMGIGGGVYARIK